MTLKPTGCVDIAIYTHPTGREMIDVAHPNPTGGKRRRRTFVRRSPELAISPLLTDLSDPNSSIALTEERVKRIARDGYFPRCVTDADVAEIMSAELFLLLSISDFRTLVHALRSALDNPHPVTHAVTHTAFSVINTHLSRSLRNGQVAHSDRAGLLTRIRKLADRGAGRRRASVLSSVSTPINTTMES